MSGPQRPRRGSIARGYTLVELMMALALFAVAVVGIIAMQKITVTSNAHAKNMAMAQRIAQAWAGQLEMEATTWRTTLGSDWLNADNAWQRPKYIPARAFGGAFDALGNPLKDDEASNAAFCTHVRMTWLYPTTMAVAGNGMLRAEIRVFWLRDNEAPVDSTSLCPVVQDTDTTKKIGLATDRYHFVYQTVGVRQHPQI